MSPVELVADTNVVSYIYNETPLGSAYEELIGARSVGITGHTIAELRAGVFMARWGERRQANHLRDHEGIAGLRVLTLHTEWEARETDRGAFKGGPLPPPKLYNSLYPHRTIGPVE